MEDQDLKDIEQLVQAIKEQTKLLKQAMEDLGGRVDLLENSFFYTPVRGKFQ